MLNSPIRLILMLLASAVVACAHPADVSQLRVRVEHDHVEFRFSLNIAALARFVVIDANQDNKVVYSEIEKTVPLVRDFLIRSVLVTFNDDDADIGEFKKFVCVWPSPQTSEINPQEAGQRFVDFNFSKAWPKGVQEVWLGFKVFERLGDLHTIQCIFQQQGEPDTPVDFSSNEPDYLYDTGWDADAAKMQSKDSTAMAPMKVITLPPRVVIPCVVLAILAVWLIWNNRKQKAARFKEG